MPTNNASRHFGAITHEFHRVDADRGNEVVVVGDPQNGSYEWLIRTPAGGVVQHSDDGYGDPAQRGGVLPPLPCMGYRPRLHSVPARPRPAALETPSNEGC